ncbi:V-type ATP synthase subunit D [Salinicola peritrichatus]|jgi:V/A-type H+-transporting ATPase subunit D|uniref:V-type ATP synthase subunit D n=1 Tax=Salinicola peritrichatus TaxID=1267424 RepID=UPI0013A64544|nr:V-type ATP synthase subunit D [Salinicola peritrichatus]
MYQRYLPALEMKQRMLLMLQKQAQSRMHELREQREALQAEVGEELSMLADDMPLPQAPLQVSGVRVVEENLVGVTLPRLEGIDIERHAYGLLSQAHWMERLVERSETMLRLRIETQVMERRLALLDEASRTVTQRVNLFSKVMIPTVSHQIARIDLYLADQERAAVVRSKLAKQKHAAEGKR